MVLLIYVYFLCLYLLTHAAQLSPPQKSEVNIMLAWCWWHCWHCVWLPWVSPHQMTTTVYHHGMLVVMVVMSPTWRTPTPGGRAWSPACSAGSWTCGGSRGAAAGGSLHQDKLINGAWLRTRTGYPESPVLSDMKYGWKIIEVHRNLEI